MVIETPSKNIDYSFIEVFIQNASKLKPLIGESTKANKGLEKKEKVTGVWKGKEISFTKSFGGEEFTDEEVQLLLNGESITITRKKKNGKTYKATGKLKEKTYKKKKFVGFDIEKFD